MWRDVQGRPGTRCQETSSGGIPRIHSIPLAMGCGNMSEMLPTGEVHERFSALWFLLGAGHGGNICQHIPKLQTCGRKTGDQHKSVHKGLGTMTWTPLKAKFQIPVKVQPFQWAFWWTALSSLQYLPCPTYMWLGYMPYHRASTLTSSVAFKSVRHKKKKKT